MARIRIELPERFTFSTDIPLLVSHINYGNHLDNAQLLGIVSEARVRFLKSMGYSELDIEGLGIIVADAALQYRSEAFHGETMRVEMAPADFNRYGFDLVFCMTEKASGREVARGKIGIVFIGKASRKVAPIPDSIRQLLLARAGAPGSPAVPERVSSPST